MIMMETLMDMMIMDSDLMRFMRILMDSDMMRMLMVMLRMLVGMLEMNMSLYIMTSGNLLSCHFWPLFLTFLFTSMNFFTF